MSYTVTNFRTKRALKEAVALANTPHTNAEAHGHQPVRVQADALPFQSSVGPTFSGVAYIEGPHYPRPHTWYAQVQVKDGIIVRVIS